MFLSNSNCVLLTLCNEIVHFLETWETTKKEFYKLYLWKIFIFVIPTVPKSQLDVTVSMKVPIITADAKLQAIQIILTTFSSDKYLAVKMINEF